MREQEPAKVAMRYAKLTGMPSLPPLFSLGYHQCRWNYRDERDLLQVHEAFDEHRMPVDVLWLDIEHTDGKRYFTWDRSLFPQPLRMQEQLAAKGRRLVTIVDPHLKQDDQWAVYREVTQQGLAVKNIYGQTFTGNCWPGQSVWTDYLNPKARAWWASRFAFDKYTETGDHLWIWNDMNEPSVFGGPEVTMPKDCLHVDGAGEKREHREIHNLYGHLMQQSTWEGLQGRNATAARPFLLSRSFYAGSQRWGAIWTGDTAATWGYLKLTIPMLLSMSVAGLPFVGADVGGFFGNPDAELQVRWYQAGSLQPFFRAHAHIDARRREPWLLPEGDYREAARQALILRYQLLYYWYALFEEAHRTGNPPMRPMWWEWDGYYGVEDQYLVGEALLVKPVCQPDVKKVTVEIPEGSWYSWGADWKRVEGGSYEMAVDLKTIPMFVRGGHALPLKMRPRRSSEAMQADPFTILVAYNEGEDEEVRGSIYVDDNEAAEHVRVAIRATRHQLICIPVHSSDRFNPSTQLERVMVLGNRISKAMMGSKSLPVHCEGELCVIKVGSVDLQETVTILFT